MSDAVAVETPTVEASDGDAVETISEEKLDSIEATLAAVGGDLPVEGGVRTQDDGDDPAEKPQPSAPEKPAVDPAVAEAEYEAREAQVRSAQLEEMTRRRRQAEETKRHRSAIEYTQRVTGAARNWRENPVAFLETAGISPVDFYQTMTGYAIRDGQPDPTEVAVQRAVSPHVQALERERAQLAEERKRFQMERETTQRANAIASKIVPELNPEAHEALLAFHDGDTTRAATAVMDAIVEHYQETGKTVTVASAIKLLDDYHSGLLDKAIEKLSKTKRFGSRFAGAAPKSILSSGSGGARVTLGGTPKRAGGAPAPRNTRPLTGDAAIAETLAALGEGGSLDE